MKKRGQITIFFIVGIIILLMVGTYFAVRTVWFKDTSQKEFEKKTEIPTKIKPVNDYLENCLKNKVQEGIDILSLQGGYINLQTDSTPISAFSPIDKNLEIIQGSDVKTAVWFRERGNTIQESNIPSKEFMEKELESYINKRFIDCIEEITSFTNEGYNLASSGTEVSSKIIIFDGTVNVQAKFPITITNDDVSFTIDNYIAVVESPIGRLYKLATQIMKKENEELIFENKTMNILIAYDPEVPFASLDTFCGDKRWSKSEVISKLKNNLEMNTAAMKIKGTQYTLPDNFKIMELNMLDSEEDDLTINFMYSKSWPTFADIQPSKGDILTSSSFSSGKGGEYTQILTQFMCLNSYQFIYILKYPILISITDEKGNSFSFATEVIIDNNQPRKNTLVPQQIEDTSSTICEFPTSIVNVVTYTFDKNGNNLPLNDVDIELKCTPSTCPIGKVQKDAQARLQTPSCYNGIIIGKKDGFLNAKEIQTIKPDQEEYVNLYLEPIYKKKVKIKIIDKFSGEIRDPYESEEALIQFRMNNKNYNTNYIYPEQQETELAAGEYTIKATLFRESTWPITTQTKTTEHCITTPEASILGALGFSKTTECENIEIPSMEFNQVMTGGEEFNYTLERQYLADQSSLIIYIMADAIPSNMEELSNIQEKISVNNKHQSFRYPEYE
jgi:hypothetical protein